MSRPFAVFDIDGTLIRWQLFHTLIDALARKGHISDDEYQAIRSARMTWKRRENDDSFGQYEKTMVEIFEKHLFEISTLEFDAVTEQVIDEYKDQVYRYTRDLIKDLRAQNYMLFAISGSPTQVIKKLATHYSFDDWIGAEYEQCGAKFTGKIDLPVGKKHEALALLVEKYDLGYAGSIGVGDSSGDISMLEAVERAIAFNPDKNLYKVAKENDWEIIVERKNVVYELKPEGESYLLR